MVKCFIAGRSGGLLLAEPDNRFSLVLEALIQDREPEQIENIIDLWRHVRELDVSLVLSDIFNKSHEDTQASATDVGKVFAVDDYVEFPVGQQSLEGVFEIRCSVGIEIPFEVDDTDAFSVSLEDLEISHGGLLLLDSMELHAFFAYFPHSLPSTSDGFRKVLPHMIFTTTSVISSPYEEFPVWLRISRTIAFLIDSADSFRPLRAIVTSRSDPNSSPSEFLASLAPSV